MKANVCICNEFPLFRQGALLWLDKQMEVPQLRLHSQRHWQNHETNRHLKAVLHHSGKKSRVEKLMIIQNKLFDKSTTRLTGSGPYPCLLLLHSIEFCIVIPVHKFVTIFPFTIIYYCSPIPSLLCPPTPHTSIVRILLLFRWGIFTCVVICISYKYIVIIQIEQFSFLCAGYILS
jgi:hypothetical protein